MAQRGTNFDTLFANLQREIVKTFEELFRALEKRKRDLLSRLSAMKAANDNNVELDAAIKQLRIAKEQALSAISNNLPSGVVDTIGAGFQYFIRVKEDKKVPTEDVSLFEFRCLSDHIHKGIIETDLVELIPEYIGRERPILQKCPLGINNGALQNARGVAIDKKTDEIYIADQSNHRIQVMNAKGDFLRGFTHDYMLALHAICLSKKDVFTTDKRSYLLKFSKSGEFLKQTGSRGDMAGCFVAITGLCYKKGFVYVCDSSLQYVQIFDSDLKFHKVFGYGGITSPTAINFYSSRIFILSEDQNEIYCYSKELLRLHTINLVGQKTLMTAAEFFTIDSNGNFLIADGDCSEIRIFSPNGYLKHTLGKGYLKFLSGIALDGSNAIICVNFGRQNKCFQKY